MSKVSLKEIPHEPRIYARQIFKNFNSQVSRVFLMFRNIATSAQEIFKLFIIWFIRFMNYLRSALLCIFKILSIEDLLANIHIRGAKWNGHLRKAFASNAAFSVVKYFLILPKVWGLYEALLQSSLNCFFCQFLYPVMLLRLRF